MAKFKVGDKVRVREDLVVDKEYGVNTFVEFMERYKGRILTISSADEVDSRGYKLEGAYYYWTDEMLEEVKEEVKMEKTFREVIADIKEGEVWESNEKTITMKNDRIVFQVKEGRERIVNGSEKMMFSLDKKYKLQRKECTFQEAFKAFEEGKKIESCEGVTYKKCSEDSYLMNGVKYNFEEIMLSINEIKNKWYIND